MSDLPKIPEIPKMTLSQYKALGDTIHKNNADTKVRQAVAASLIGSGLLSSALLAHRMRRSAKSKRLIDVDSSYFSDIIKRANAVTFRPEPDKSPLTAAGDVIKSAFNPISKAVVGVRDASRPGSTALSRNMWGASALLLAGYLAYEAKKKADKAFPVKSESDQLKDSLQNSFSTALAKTSSAEQALDVFIDELEKQSSIVNLYGKHMAPAAVLSAVISAIVTKKMLENPDISKSAAKLKATQDAIQRHRSQRIPQTYLKLVDDPATADAYDSPERNVVGIKRKKKDDDVFDKLSSSNSLATLQKQAADCGVDLDDVREVLIIWSMGSKFVKSAAFTAAQQTPSTGATMGTVPSPTIPTPAAHQFPSNFNRQFFDRAVHNFSAFEPDDQRSIVGNIYNSPNMTQHHSRFPREFNADNPDTYNYLWDTVRDKMDVPFAGPILRSGLAKSFNSLDDNVRQQLLVGTDGLTTPQGRLPRYLDAASQFAGKLTPAQIVMMLAGGGVAAAGRPSLGIPLALASAVAPQLLSRYAPETWSSMKGMAGRYVNPQHSAFRPVVEMAAAR